MSAVKSANDDVILQKLRRSLPGNVKPGELQGNWFTRSECVRLLEMLGEIPAKGQQQ